MNWALIALKKYAVFDGRARRKEYWFYVLFYVIASTVLTIVDGVIGTLDVSAGVGVLSGLFFLGTFLPSMGVTIRRLHDTNHGGPWILIGLIPCLGTIVMLLFMLFEGTPGPNRFGPDPKATGA